ncbi:MAG: hypothetical protein KF687_11435 [Cyclobacteriaceae bacterium]|nr:hypothetical protein [Cyclobacteriaceae bacterium]
MATFSIKFEQRNNYLLAIGQGSRNSLIEVFEGTRAIAKALAETGCRYVLVDYANVITKLPVVDAFNIVRIYESKVSEFQDIVLAVVINPSEEHFDSFWEKICRIRGYQFKIFTNRTAAEDWLQNGAKQH